MKLTNSPVNTPWLCKHIGHKFTPAYNEVPNPQMDAPFKIRGCTPDDLRELGILRTVHVIYCTRCGEFK